MNKHVIARGAAAVLAVAALAGCDPHEFENTSLDVVVSSGTSRNGDETTYHVDCGPYVGAVPEYEVLVPKEVSYNAVEGELCPAGERRAPIWEREPELYAEVSEVMSAELPYEGGDPESACGAWGTTELEEARKWAKECGPVTRWDGQPR